MSTSPWTLEAELCKFAGTDDLNQALVKLRMISKNSVDYSIRSDDDWVRGGAETYIYRFWITEQSGRETGYILKACVTLSDIDSTIESWLKRRWLLEANGINVPNLKHVQDGVILEELIPFTLKEALFSARHNQFQELAYQLAGYSGLLNRLRFSPTDAFVDLRSNGTNVFVVDFGQDLGPPNTAQLQNDVLFEAMINTLNSWKISLDNQFVRKLRKVFERESNRESVIRG